jgi:hypothetical protein
MRLAPDLYRIPDVAVFAEREPQETVPSRPPVVTIEIVSRDDRYSAVLEKLAEYQQWGWRIFGLSIRIDEPLPPTKTERCGLCRSSRYRVTLSSFPPTCSPDLEGFSSRRRFQLTAESFYCASALFWRS